MAIAPGDVVHVYVQSLRNPKYKYCVVAAVDPRAILLLINSNLTQFKEESADILAGQLQIDAASHAFLGYDSWLDCTETHCMDLPQLEAECEKPPQRVVGQISPAMRASILGTVQTSRVLSARDIRRIVAGLT